MATKRQSIQQIVHQHWETYGRNAYVRHDYEAIETSSAEALMEHLQTEILALPGTQLGEQNVSYADNFSYTDPIDQSVSNNQGVRIGFSDGSRMVFRLSGTGTQGATLRLYLETFTTNPDQFQTDASELLSSLAALANEVAKIQHFTGRSHPDVIT